MTEELQDNSQLSFFGLELIVNRTKPVYHATGKILRRQRPEVHRIAVELLGQGRHSGREICRLLHISPHTLESIEADQAENLATLRQKAARKNLELHAMSLDRIEELIPRANDVAKLAVTAGILAEKSQLLAGEATARIESNAPADLLQRFEAFCGALEKRAQAREIVVSVEQKFVKDAGATGDSSLAELPAPGSPAELEPEPAIAGQESDGEPDVSNQDLPGNKTDPDDSPDDSDRSQVTRARCVPGPTLAGGGAGVARARAAAAADA
jgi:hypothetical protein